MSLVLEDSIEKIEGLNNKIKDSINNVKFTSDDEVVEINMVVKIDIKNTDAWHDKLDSIKEYL